MPKPADYFAPAVLGKMLEDKLKGDKKPGRVEMMRRREEDENEPEVEDVIGTPLEDMGPDLPPVRRPRRSLPEPLPMPRPRFVRGAKEDRWEAK